MQALTPYDVKDTFMYYLAEKGRPDLIELAYTSPDTFDRDVLKRASSEDKEFREKLGIQDPGRTDATQRWYMNFGLASTMNNRSWLPLISDITKRKMEIRTKKLPTGITSRIGMSSSCLYFDDRTHKDNLRMLNEIKIVLEYEGIITDKWGLDNGIAGLYNSPLGSSDFYIYFHEQIHGSLHENFAKFINTEKKLNDLQVMHELELKEKINSLRTSHESELNSLRTSHENELKSINERLETLNQDLKRVQDIRADLQVQLKEEYTKNLSLSETNKKLQEENFKLKNQLKIIFGMKEELENPSKLEEHHERLNLVEGIVAEDHERLNRIETYENGCVRVRDFVVLV